MEMSIAMIVSWDYAYVTFITLYTFLKNETDLQSALLNDQHIFVVKRIYLETCLCFSD